MGHSDTIVIADGNFPAESMGKNAKVIRCDGHIGADLITLCSILRIPVCMHNVPEEKIFRPAAWNAFGMDKEGQDYRACQTYGPMYK